VNDVKVGLVCFKLKGSNDLNRKLLDSINESGRLHMVPTYMKGEYVIRFAVCAEKATEDDMDAAWKIIEEFASTVLPLTTLPTTPILYEKSRMTRTLVHRSDDECSFTL